MLEAEVVWRLPEDYTCIDDEGEFGLMTNFDHTIDPTLAAKLKTGPYYGTYPGGNFCGHAVWWDAQAAVYRCEVWQWHAYMETVSAETLEELMERVSERYGYA